MKLLAGMTALALVVALSTSAQAQVSSERVQFAKGASSKTLAGTLKGEQTIDYLVGARAGQRMDVKLETRNGSNYFNVLPPGSDTALFVGASSGGTFSGTLPVSGDYRIRVYLMRNAARRNEMANYALTVAVHGAPTAHAPSPAAKAATGKGDPIRAGNRPAYCRGEVSGMFGTRPNYVKTDKPVRAGDGGSAISGTVDKGSEGVKRFRCSFDANGRFIEVMALTPDGE